MVGESLGLAADTSTGGADHKHSEVSRHSGLTGQIVTG